MCQNIQLSTQNCSQLNASVFQFVDFVVIYYEFSYMVKQWQAILGEFNPAIIMKMKNGPYYYFGRIKHLFNAFGPFLVSENVNKSTNAFACETEIVNITTDCSQHQGLYQCEDKSCIWNDLRCDGNLDCPDGSDEKCEAICYLLDDDPGVTYCRDKCKSPQCVCDLVFFQCQAGGCINSKFLCDRNSDCSDGSDEIHCMDSLMKLDNSKKDFKCSDGRTLRTGMVNDLVADCIFGEDESIFEASVVQKKMELKQHDSFEHELKRKPEVCSSLGSFSCVNMGNRCFEMDDICLYDTYTDGTMKICRHGTHLVQCLTDFCFGRFKCDKSYCLPSHKICDGIKDCLEGDDEEHCPENFVCEGHLKCRSGICVHPDYICDGYNHCGSGEDDEALCTTPECPEDCHCFSASIVCKKINLPKLLLPMNSKQNVKILIYSKANAKLDSDTLQEYVQLYSLDISFNNLEQLERSAFLQLASLVILNLSFNNISALFNGNFHGLKSLVLLNISNNPIKIIHKDAFSGLQLLASLNLKHLEISSLFTCSFCGLPSLEELDISGNKIRTFPENIFVMTPWLVKLRVTSNDIHNIGVSNIRSSVSLRLIAADRSSVCCVSVHADQCIAPHHDVFTTCEDLLGSLVLRYTVWFILVGAFITNLLVILYRSVCFKITDIQNFLIINLSMADIISPIYLLMLSAYDVRTRGYFIAVSREWQMSIMCRIMAVLSTVSANVSLYIISILTLYRANGILGKPNFGYYTITVSVLIGWLFHTLLASIPVWGVMKFDVPDSCLLFSFSSYRTHGWYYSFFALTLINIIPLSGIVVEYIRIICKVMSTIHNPMLAGSIVSGKKKSSAVPLNVLLLVGSNLLTWIPIMTVSVLAVIPSVTIPTAVSRYVITSLILVLAKIVNITRLWHILIIIFHVPAGWLCLFSH